MKKLMALLLALTLVLGMAPAFAEGETYELALVMDSGVIDDKSFHQGSWEGIQAYAEPNGITSKYYSPSEESKDAYMSSIELAVNNGAKLIVLPGYLLEEAVFDAQDIYPDVKFVLVDGNPHDADYNYNTAANTTGVTYADMQAGFLAGYAAVKNGYTKLGFMGGMAVPAVVGYGYGFLQGADYAAKEMGIESVEANYTYTGAFMATPEAKATAASWYNAGTEVIFGCGGSLGNSVMAAAEEIPGKAVIGVDVDQSGESETVVISALKNLSGSVHDIIEMYYNDSFPGGQGSYFSATNNGVGLSMESSKLENFTQADYDAIFAKLAADEDGIATAIKGATDADGNMYAVDDLGLEIVKTTVVE